MTKTILYVLVADCLIAVGCGSDNGRGDDGGIRGLGGTGTTGSGGATAAMGGATADAETGQGGGGGTAGMTGDGCMGTGGWADGGGLDAVGSDGGVAWLSPPTVPPALTVPAGATLKDHVRGVGVQVYVCAPSGGAGAGVDGGDPAYAWTFKAPDARLFDATGTQVGTHGAGPNWTSTIDGSYVNGTKAMQTDAPLPSAIPWLLLRSASTSGTGVWGDISYVQRVNTTGGKAPATGCDTTTADATVRVDYTADYYFYVGGAGAAWSGPPAGVPAALAVPAGATLKIHDRGIGVQIYTCTGSAGVDGGDTTYAWVLKAPDAILYDATFAQVGSHGAGPSWTSSDGSVVNGARLQQAEALDAIPWLLLKATPTTGAGVFSDIAYVQRLNTAGGKAPPGGCDATTAGAETRVSYAADYYFFTVANLDGSTGG